MRGGDSKGCHVRATADRPMTAPQAPPAPFSRSVRRAWRPLAIYCAARLWMLLALLALVAVHRTTTFFRALASWDGGWYLRLAQHGYPHSIPTSGGQTTQSTLGFFPLFPLAMRELHALTGLTYLVSGEVIVTIFGATFALTLWWLMRHLFSEPIADRATALVCFFPGSFVFALIYSEPLSLTLTALCLYALIRRWWWLAGISAALASAARPNAIVLAACCVWGAAVAIAKQRQWTALAAAALAPLGLLIHFSFLYFRTGNFWAYQISQEQAWKLKLRLSTPVHLLRTFAGHPLAQDVVLQVLGTAFIVAAAVVLLRSHYPGVVVVYGIGLGVLDLCLVPSPRFVLTAFPLVAVVGHRLRGRWFGLALAGSAVGLAGLLVQTVLGRLTP
jgi:Mannosyltransferase (PIG-V)